MTDARPDDIPNGRSPFVSHALELGKIYRQFSESQGAATSEEAYAMIHAAIGHMADMVKNEPQGPIDALILLSCARDLIFAVQRGTEPELIPEYCLGAQEMIARVVQYLMTTTGATLQSQGINLTGKAWN